MSRTKLYLVRRSTVGWQWSPPPYPLPPTPNNAASLSTWKIVDNNIGQQIFLPLPTPQTGRKVPYTLTYSVVIFFYVLMHFNYYKSINGVCDSLTDTEILKFFVFDFHYSIKVKFLILAPVSNGEKKRPHTFRKLNKHIVKLKYCMKNCTVVCRTLS